MYSRRRVLVGCAALVPLAGCAGSSVPDLTVENWLPRDVTADVSVRDGADEVVEETVDLAAREEVGDSVSFPDPVGPGTVVVGVAVDEGPSGSFQYEFPPGSQYGIRARIRDGDVTFVTVSDTSRS